MSSYIHKIKPGSTDRQLDGKQTYISQSLSDKVPFLPFPYGTLKINRRATPEITLPIKFELDLGQPFTAAPGTKVKETWHFVKGDSFRVEIIELTCIGLLCLGFIFSLDLKFYFPILRCFTFLL